jgi:patatin-like phospholipase/acyl hydrolase
MSETLHIASRHNIIWERVTYPSLDYFIPLEQLAEAYNTISEKVIDIEWRFDDETKDIELLKADIIKIKKYIDDCLVKNKNKKFYFRTTKHLYDALKNVSYQELSELFGVLLTKSDPNNEYIVISYF